MTDEREDPAVFGPMGASKVRIGRKTKLFLSVYDAEVIVRSNASAVLRYSDGNAVGTAKL